VAAAGRRLRASRGVLVGGLGGHSGAAVRAEGRRSFGDGGETQERSSSPASDSPVFRVILTHFWPAQRTPGFSYFAAIYPSWPPRLPVSAACAAAEPAGHYVSIKLPSGDVPTLFFAPWLLPPSLPQAPSPSLASL
jgi:hypothetical protein